MTREGRKIVIVWADGIDGWGEWWVTDCARREKKPKSRNPKKSKCELIEWMSWNETWNKVFAGFYSASSRHAHTAEVRNRVNASVFCVHLCFFFRELCFRSRVNFLNFFFLHSFWIEIWERSQSRLLRDGSLHARQKATMTRSTAIQKKSLIQSSWLGFFLVVWICFAQRQKIHHWAEWMRNEFTVFREPVATWSLHEQSSRRRMLQAARHLAFVSHNQIN